MNEKGPLGCLLLLFGIPLVIGCGIGLYYGFKGVGNNDPNIVEDAKYVLWSSGIGFLGGAVLLWRAIRAFKNNETFNNKLDP